MAELRNEGWGRRLRSAARWWADREDITLTPSALAKAFYEQGGRQVSRQAMARWLDGYEPRSFKDVEILAAVLDQPGGWLAFGEGQPRAHAPLTGVPVSGRYRDDAEDLTPPVTPSRRRRKEG